MRWFLDERAMAVGEEASKRSMSLSSAGLDIGLVRDNRINESKYRLNFKIINFSTPLYRRISIIFGAIYIPWVSMKSKYIFRINRNEVDISF